MGLMRKIRRNLGRKGLETISSTRTNASCNGCGRKFPYNFMTDGHWSSEWNGFLSNECSPHGTRLLCPKCADQGKYPCDCWGKSPED